MVGGCSRKRPPGAPEALPALLEAATHDAALGAAVAPVLGERGRWLAEKQPHWRRVLARHANLIAPLAVDAQSWRVDDAAERRSLFAALRRADPAAARELLGASWGGENGEDREAFVAVLSVGLSSADEPLLETVLRDRRKGVRDQAAGLLARLPGSAYCQRMAARARDAVRVEHRLLRPRFLVTPPAECDAGMRADGMVAKPPYGGERSWWLRQIVAAAPLSVWTEMTGSSPATVVNADADGDWRPVLVDGWIAAARSQHDREWALALLDGPFDKHLDAERRVELMSLLDTPERVAHAVALLRSSRGPAKQDVAWVLAACPKPWPSALSDAAVAWLAAAAAADQPIWMNRHELLLVGHRLPPDRAAAITALARTIDESSPWGRVLFDVADTLTTRHDMLEELL